LAIVRSIHADWECGDFASANWADSESVVVGGVAPVRWIGGAMSANLYFVRS
jgi:hypothetical protein